MIVNPLLKEEILGFDLYYKFQTVGLSTCEIQKRIYELELQDKIKYYFGCSTMTVKEFLNHFSVRQGTREIDTQVCIFCQTKSSKPLLKTPCCSSVTHKECLILTHQTDGQALCTCGQVLDIKDKTIDGTILEDVGKKRQRDEDEDLCVSMKRTRLN